MWKLIKKESIPLNMFIISDDSGDPGFKFGKGSSTFFVIALVIFDDPLDAEEASLAIKRIRRTLNVSDLFEFKFNKTNSDFRESFFDAVRKAHFNIRAIVVDKEKLQSPRFRNQKEDFYNYVCQVAFKNVHNFIFYLALLSFYFETHMVLLLTMQRNE
jgi:hypothetical protein